MIIVDVETTGLDPRKNSIVSIGAVDFENPSNIFYEECRIWDGAEINMEALRINGFTFEQIHDPARKSLKEAVDLFLAWSTTASDNVLAGSNVSFDYNFLKASAERYAILWRFPYRTIELQSLFYIHILKRVHSDKETRRASKFTTNEILKYAGLPEEPKPHVGLVGAKIEAEAFSRLIYGKGLLAEYEHFAIPEYLV